MEIENVTTLLRQHVYGEGLQGKEVDASEQEDQFSTPLDHTPAWEATLQLPWTTARKPFSPPTMGYPLPYLDVMTVQSKRLLPVTRKELEAQHHHPSHVEYHSPSRVPQAQDDHSAITLEETRDEENENLTPRSVKSDDRIDNDAAPLDFDAILRSVRLLVEPLAIPDLSHTGVKWQLGQTNLDSDTKPPQLCVTVPNHSFDETQVKLFYPTGAKNTNMREYIKDTIQKHMTGYIPESIDKGRSSPTKSITGSQLTGSQSMPVLQGIAEPVVGSSSPGNKTIKAKHKTTSPTKSSPQKRSGISSGARLSGSVSTSGLLNPDLTRQTKDILTQLRANTNKINDLIGS